MKNSIQYSLIVLLTITGLRVSAQNVTNQTRDVSGFSSLASSGPFQVHVKLDGTESLKLTADDELINDIETVVEKQTLTIRFKKEARRIRQLTKADVYITAKTLKALVNSGSGSIKVDGTINSDDFSAVLSGSGNMAFNVKTQKLNTVISGSGSVDMSGTADEAKVVVSGSGEFHAKQLNTQNTSAVVTGSGNVYVAANKSIDAKIVGSGQVIYSGTASVNSKTLGSGRVVKAN